MLRRANQYRPNNLSQAKDDLLTEMKPHRYSSIPSSTSLLAENKNILRSSESLESLVNLGTVVNQLPPLQKKSSLKHSSRTTVNQA